MNRPLAATLALTAAAALAVAWSRAPVEPLAADVAPTIFSEGRARPIVDRLAGEIGHRLAGSAGAERAREFVLSELRAIPGLEVEVQEAIGVAEGYGPAATAYGYTVHNVVARLTGATDEAVLLAAHYDTPPGSVGAADDALGVATVIETARCLAAGPRPRRSVVFLIDEGEELGLFGAMGFLPHRWAADVVAYLNLESAGARGRPILFQSGPDAPWIAAAYARAAPHPHGTVLGQDVFQSGVIPSDTDFRIYRDAGLVGLDLALYRDGWAYHTHLDTPERLEPGSLQEMGDNALAVVRHLAEMDLADPQPSESLESVESPESAASAGAAAYWDVVGVWMVAYDGETAAWLAVGALLLLVAAAWRAAVRPGRALVWGALRQVGALVVGGIAAGGAAWGLDAVGRGVGWYAQPWLAWPAFAGSGLTASVAFLALTRARDAVSTAATSTPTAALLTGAGAVHASLLIAALGLGLGSAYVPLLWTVGAGVALALVRRPVLALVLGTFLPRVVTLQPTDAVLETFAATAGRLQAPMDVPIALIAAVPCLLASLVPLAFVIADPPRGARWWWATLALTGTAALVAVGAVAPYSAMRPKRLAVRVPLGAEAGPVSIASMDGLACDDPRAPIAWEIPVVEPTDAPPVAFIAPVAAGSDPGAPTAPATRRARVVVAQGAESHRLVLTFSADRVSVVTVGGDANWSLPVMSVRGSAATLVLVAPRSGLELTFDVIGDEPLHVEASARGTSVPPGVVEQLAELPSWTTVRVTTVAFDALDL